MATVPSPPPGDPSRSGPLPSPPTGDPMRFTTLAHAGRSILGPADGAQLDSLLDGLNLPPGARVLDVGCGKGDLLVRAARRGATGVGVDRNPWFIADARALAGSAGVGDRVTFEVGDTEEMTLPDELDLAACVGATGALGGPVRAPGELASIARRGGAVIIGEGFWRVPPERAWLEAFGMEPDEMLDREGTLRRMWDGGLEVVDAQDASEEGWEMYEDEYASSIERWAAAHPDDPDRAAFLERTVFMRETWGGWRRRAMGFVTVSLRRV
jgi:SAM-dependent methyltransferase